MKTIKFFLISFSILICNLNIAFCQLYDNNWMTGLSGLYKGGQISFTNGGPSIDSLTTNTTLNITNSSMSDSSGNLIFYTNGINIYDSTHNIMSNGDSLSPCIWTNSNNTGLNLVQGSLAIPVPGQNKLYYLFHQSWDLYFPTTNYHPATLYYSIIDMSLNNGLGAVTQKNDTLYYLPSGLISHGLAAAKHANGRDWWLIHHKAQTNEFVKWLITPSGINGPYVQNIGLPPYYAPTSDLTTGLCFSPDGSKFAYLAKAGFGSVITKRVDYFNFDRCTGLFSNTLNFLITDSSSLILSDAFSPNGRFLYITSDYFIYQYDTWAANIDSSRQTVADFDSNLYLGYPTAFTFMQLGPDGKIYISLNAAPDYLSVINDPDQLGLACNVTQHSFNTLVRNQSVPNNPNYRLGSLTGSACDTLTGINLVVNEISGLTINPNPNNSKFKITYSLHQNKSGELSIVDFMGREVFKQYLPPFSNTQNISLDKAFPGLYFCRINCANKQQVIKFLIY